MFISTKIIKLQNLALGFARREGTHDSCLLMLCNDNTFRRSPCGAGRQGCPQCVGHGNLRGARRFAAVNRWG